MHEKVGGAKPHDCCVVVAMVLKEDGEGHKQRDREPHYTEHTKMMRWLVWLTMIPE